MMVIGVLCVLAFFATAVRLIVANEKAERKAYENDGK